MRDPPHAVIYQLKIALRGISPLIWRRLLVSADTSIVDLHHILQLVLGWTNSHLHRFLIHGKESRIAYDGGRGFADDPRQTMRTKKSTKPAMTLTISTAVRSMPSCDDGQREEDTHEDARTGGY